MSEHKLEAIAHKLELCLARGNLIAMETDVTAQLSRIQFLWQHLKEYGDLRVAELNFAIKMEVRRMMIIYSSNMGTSYISAVLPCLPIGPK